MRQSLFGFWSACSPKEKVLSDWLCTAGWQSAWNFFIVDSYEESPEHMARANGWLTVKLDFFIVDSYEEFLGHVARSKWFVTSIWLGVNVLCCTVEQLCHLHRWSAQGYGCWCFSAQSYSTVFRWSYRYPHHISRLAKRSIGKRPREERPQLEWANCANQEAVLEAHLEEAPTFAFLLFCCFHVFRPQPKR